ncbi:MAG: hypothetical protein V4621_04415 [Pseudomonadota bacterium]
MATTGTLILGAGALAAAIGWTAMRSDAGRDLTASFNKTWTDSTHNCHVARQQYADTAGLYANISTRSPRPAPLFHCPVPPPLNKDLQP